MVCVLKRANKGSVTVWSAMSYTLTVRGVFLLLSQVEATICCLTGGERLSGDGSGNRTHQSPARSILTNTDGRHFAPLGLIGKDATVATEIALVSGT